MAKTQRELSPAEKSLSDLKVKLSAAKEADSKNSTDKTKAAVTNAQKAVADQLSIVNRERFVRVGGNRATKARDAIRNLAAVAAPRSYSYSEADIEKLQSMLNSEVSNAIAKLKGALTKGPAAAKTSEGFSF